MNAQAQTTEQEINAFLQAKAQANSIAAMVAALSCDYDRLEELRNERDGYENAELGNLASSEVHRIAWEQENPQDAEELRELEEAAGDCKNEDDARERIQEDPLSVQVREDWKNPGEESTPSEFQILLCTGGPAVRIMGELDEHLQPCRAWIEYQDWGTPWTHAYNVIEQSTLLEYCRQFYFGE